MNKVTNYLSKILTTYPENFKIPLRAMNFEGYIKGHYIYHRKYYEVRDFTPNIFIHVKPNKYIKDLKKSALCVDSIVENDKSIMLVVDIKNEWLESYRNFLLSRYSKMYTKDMYRKLDIRENVNGKKSVCFAVINKTEVGLEYMLKKIKKEYGTTMSKDELSGEYDTPIGENECFNPTDYKDLKLIIDELKNGQNS